MAQRQSRSLRGWDVEIVPEPARDKHCIYCLIDENQGFNIIGGNVCYIFSLGNPIHSVGHLSGVVAMGSCHNIDKSVC